MVDDSRTSRSPRSGNVSISAGSSGSSVDLISIRSEVSLSLEDLIVSYENSATNQTVIELYDDVEGTSAVNLSNRLFSFDLSPNDTLILDDLDLSDISNDLIVVSTNNDGEVNVNAGGLLVE